MGFEITPHTGMNIIAHDLTEDDLLVLHTDLGQWYLSVAVEPFLQLDPEFGGSALNYKYEAPFLDIVHLRAAKLPDLRWWFNQMMIDDKPAFRRGAPGLIPPYITATTRQAERARRGLAP